MPHTLLCSHCIHAEMFPVWLHRRVRCLMMHNYVAEVTPTLGMLLNEYQKVASERNRSHVQQQNKPDSLPHRNKSKHSNNNLSYSQNADYFCNPVPLLHSSTENPASSADNQTETKDKQREMHTLILLHSAN